MTCFAFKIMQPSTTSLLPDLLWSSPLQHMTRSGVKMRLETCLVTCCHLTMKDNGENMACCNSMRFVAVFFRAGSRLPYEGVMWYWYALQLWSHGMPCRDITGLLTAWLLKILAYVWNCWHQLRLKLSKDAKNSTPIRANFGFLRSIWVMSSLNTNFQ